MHLDEDRCYEAVARRDARFDGAFFAAVTSTGIYCRPVCPARLPHRANIRFYAHPAAAEAAGFRPCRRCRPDSAPGNAGRWGGSDVVDRALRLIDDGGLDGGDLESLALRLGVSGRDLRGRFVRELGASPLAVARSRRAHLARRLIDETDLSMAAVARAAGFGSMRQFGDVMERIFAMAPREMRRRRLPGSGRGRLTLRLPYRGELDWTGALGVLGFKTTAGVEHVDGDRYRRATRHGWVEVRPGAPGHLLLDARLDDTRQLARTLSRARATFDLDADVHAVADHLRTDPLLGPLAAANPGLRVVGSWDPFETTIRIIIGQLVSVKAATTVAGRLATKFGRVAPSPGPGVTQLFPEPVDVVGEEVEVVGLTRSKGDAIRAVAAAVLDGDLVLDGGVPPAELERQVLGLRGVGPWTASMITIRVGRDPDTFAPGDLGIRAALGGITARAAEIRSQPWRPFRAYAATHLWRTLT